MSVFSALGIGTGGIIGTLRPPTQAQEVVAMAIDLTPRHQSFSQTVENIEQKAAQFSTLPTVQANGMNTSNTKKDICGTGEGSRNSVKPTQPDPLQWTTWYIFSKQVNSCLVQTPYLDYEMTLQETTSKSGGKTMRLLNLCIYRADGQPVPLPSVVNASSITTSPEAISSHRRFSIIQHALKEIKTYKKQYPEEGIHGLVVYRLNFELLLPQNDASYKAIVQHLQSQNEQVFEDGEQKVLYIKT